MATTALDDLLAPYEARPPRGTVAATVARHDGMEFGRHLNRIQGLDPDRAGERLASLYTTGRITAEEYRALARSIARDRLDAPGRQTVDAE